MEAKLAERDGGRTCAVSIGIFMTKKMKKFLSVYLEFLKPSLCFVVYLWGLEFQSVYEPLYASLFDSMADCGAILWCVIIAVAAAYVPIALVAHRISRLPIVYMNNCGMKAGMFLMTYFYFRRWLDRWSVTDLTNHGFWPWILAGTALLVGVWSLYRLSRASEGRSFAVPTFSDCFSFGVIPILFVSAIVLSVKVSTHLITRNSSIVGLSTSNVSTAANPNSTLRPNVLLITTDALRAESVSYAKDWGSSSTPSLKKLATTSSVYLQMHSNATATSAALTTILSGKHPLSHGNLTRKVKRYDSDENLLRVLRDYGYTTAAITSNTDAANVVAAFDRFLSRPQFPELGSQLLARLRWFGIYPTIAGAAMYRDLYLMYGLVRSFAFDLPHGYANETFELAERVISELPQPFFLFVHVNEPHLPYYALSPAAVDNSGRERFKLVREISPSFLGYYPASKQAAVDSYRAHYEESIRFLNSQLESFVSNLERKGLWSNLMFLFVSDHGESFGRMYLGHGDELYEDSTRVPLIVHFPNQLVGEQVVKLVQSADVAPTILDAAGLPTPNWMTGQALKPGRAPESRDIIAVNYKQPTENGSYHLPTMLAVWSGRHKLIISCNGDRTELYDLEKDPGEANNLARAYPDVVASLKHKLTLGLEGQTSTPKLACDFKS